MKKPSALGEVEQLVLMALLHLGKNAYGAAIWREIEQRAKRSIVGATVYSALVGLEARRFIESKWGEATPVRGGRAKKFYTITKSGHVALARSMRAVNDMQEGLEFEFATN